MRFLYRGLSWLAFEIDREPRRLLGAVLLLLGVIVGISFAIVEPTSARTSAQAALPVAMYLGELPKPDPQPSGVSVAQDEIDFQGTATVGRPFTEEPTYLENAGRETVIDIMTGRHLEAATDELAPAVEAKLDLDPVAAGPIAPLLAIIIDDLGYSSRPVSKLIELVEPITLSFLPYGPLSPDLSQWAASRGKEVFLHLPMEPLGSSDPGINALYVGLPTEEIERRVAWALEKIPDAQGVNNHMGSFATADVALVETLMDILARTDLRFVDSLTSSSSVAGRIAHRRGIPSAVRNVFLDHEPTLESILGQLAASEREARKSGTAIAIGHPYEATLDSLAEWLPEAVERGLRVVTVGDIIAAQRCKERFGPAIACSSDEMQLVEQTIAN